VTHHDDDLSAFRDDPVVRALTGPAAPDELAGEATALAGFRNAVPVRSRRRMIGRLGVGGTTLGIAVALSGGVAAAYTASLPSSVQQWSHNATHWLGPIEIPAPHHHKVSVATNHTGPQQASAPATTTPAPAPTSSPVSQRSANPASKHHRRARPQKSAGPKRTPVAAAKPSAAPTPSVTPSPTVSPSPTETPPAPGDSITISLSETTVSTGASVTAYGQLSTAAGDPVAGAHVWLMQRDPGASGVSEVDGDITGSDGSVTLQTAALTHSVRLRLVTDGQIRSAWIAVILHATVTASVSSNGTSSTIRISTDGAEPGDMVDIQRHVGDGWQDVAANQLDSSGGAMFGVPTPPRRADHYRAIVRRTPDHSFAATRFVVPPG
jgi:hypothetical protein